MKRKKLFYSLIAILPLALSSCDSGVHHGIEEYKSGEIAYHDDFTILQLTDTHISDKDDQETQFNFIKKVVNDADKKAEELHGAGHKVDMIVVTGDLFTFASTGTMKRYFDLLNSFDKYWTVTFGNHDEQVYFSIDYMTGYLNDLAAKENSKCLFKDIQDDDVTGNCNHYVNLMKDNKVFEQLIMMDSNRYHYGFDCNGYDWFKQDQIDWYKAAIKTAKDNNASSRSLMFYHIPLPEVNDAYNEAKEAGTLDGVKREDSCPPKFNSGFFTEIKNGQHTDAMFFGHDHINDFYCTYQGVIFSYGLKTDNRIYADDDLLGGQLITIDDDHSISIERVFATYGEE